MKKSERIKTFVEIGNKELIDNSRIDINENNENNKTFKKEKNNQDS